MPVAHAPATMMCGSEPVLGNASPASCTGATSSPYRVPAEIVTAPSAISSDGGSAASDRRSPVVSATGEERMPTAEHPHPLRARHQLLHLRHRRRPVESRRAEGDVARPIVDHVAILAVGPRRVDRP